MSFVQDQTHLTMLLLGSLKNGQIEKIYPEKKALIVHQCDSIWRDKRFSKKLRQKCAKVLVRLSCPKEHLRYLQSIADQLENGLAMSTDIPAFKNCWESIGIATSSINEVLEQMRLQTVKNPSGNSGCAHLDNGDDDGK